MALLLPFAVQLSHSFEHHEHACTSSDLHIDSHELDCDVFHFKIDQNSIFTPSALDFEELTNYYSKSTSFKALVDSIHIYKKPSRAPPVLLL